MAFRLLTYSSFAVAGIQPAEIERLSTVSRRNNARDAVTGLLMFNGAAFFQSIEGPTDAIDRLYGRLINDNRHLHIHLHDKRMVTNRVFDGWTMGYVQIDNGGLEGQYEIADALARDIPHPIRDLLLAMATTLPFE